MGLIAIAAVQGGVRWTDGHSEGTASWLGELLEQLDRPHAVICEPSFYDGLRDVRRTLEDWLGERGHRLVPVTDAVRATLEAVARPKITGRGPIRLLKLATIGSRAIGRLSADQDILEVRAALQVAHVVDLFDDQPDSLEEALEAVGPYNMLDDATRDALGDGRTFRTDVLLAAYRAASSATSRDTFDRLLGLTAAAHGPLNQTLRAWYVEKNTSDEYVRESALTWSDYRRALRRLFHRVKANRTALVAA